MSRIDRRTFLTLAALGVSTVALRAAADPLPKGLLGRRRKPSHAIVIGAGISGLVAARELSRAGLQVTVLEARERLGGRLFTDRSLGVPIELGATWFHGGPGNPLKAIAANLGIEARAYDASSFTVADVKTGRLVQPFHEYPWIEKELTRDFEYSVLWKSLFKRHATVEDAFGLASRRLRKVPEAEKEITFGIFRSYLEASLAESLSAASLEEMRIESDTHPEGELIPVGEEFVYGGLDRLIASFSSGLTVLKNQAVTKIEYAPGFVRVTTDTGIFEADTLVMTVPLGVLKSGDIQFSPELPRRHQVAIRNLGMGTLNKVILEFPQGRWIPESEFLAVSPRSDAPCGVFSNATSYFGKPVLIGLAGGVEARALESFSDAAIADSVLGDLRRGFGGSVPTPTAVRVTRWGRDPYSYGSYSGLPLGASTGDRRQLRKPVADTLFFAGEATDLHDYGSMHGAYWSGLRVARDISLSAKFV